MNLCHVRIVIMIRCYLISQCAIAQSPPVIIGAGDRLALSTPLAPGQITTLYVSGLTTTLAPYQTISAKETPLPTVLGGISATMSQFNFPRLVPIPLLSIVSFPCDRAPCTLTAITIQVPFELSPNYPNCLSCLNSAQIIISDGTTSTLPLDVSPVPAQVHILRGDNYLPLAVHSDGQLVTSSNPAIPGEEIVVYATGLGLSTSDRLKSGDVTPAPAPTANGVLSYDYRENASPSKARLPATDPHLRFVGLSPGSVGLYQVNFVVPPQPATLEACDNVFIGTNLTVTLISGNSFDGAGICVKPVKPE